jgi:TolB-like protein
MPIWSAEIKELNQICKSVKGKLPQLEKELGKLVTAEDENMLLVYSRRCLEVIITKLCEHELNRERGTEPLQRIIDKLNKDKIVPHNIIVSMQGVNSMSTFGAHPKEFELQQIKPVLLNLKTILEWYLKYAESLETIEVKPETNEEGRKVATAYTKEFSLNKKRIILTSSILLVCAVVVISLVVFDIGDLMQTRTKSIESLLILPLSNYTGDETLDAKLDGMHTSLIKQIGRLTGLRVINKTSSDAFKDAGMTVHEIAQKMNVNAVLETSILSWGDTISLGLELISGKKEEKQLWEGDYKDKKSQVYDMLNLITKKIADELKIKITPQEEKILAESKDVNPEALDAYLNGESFWEKLGGEDMDSAIYYFEIAIKKDPGWAAPYAGLALAWMTRGGFDSVFKDDKDEDTGKQAFNTRYYLEKALELDPNSADAHYVAALIKVWGEWNYVEAEKEFKKALELNPNHALCRMYYAHMLFILHRFEEGRQQADLALKLEPAGALILALNANLNICLGDYKAALVNCKQADSTDPENVFNQLSLAGANLLTGDTLSWFNIMKGFWALGDTNYLGYIENVYKEGGFLSVVKDRIKINEEKLSKGGEISLMDLAEQYIWIDDYDKAMNYYEKAYENREGLMNYISTYYFNYPKLKNNPRYLALLKKMNLPLPDSD